MIKCDSRTNRKYRAFQWHQFSGNLCHCQNRHQKSSGGSCKQCGEKVTIKKGTKVGKLKAANVVPPLLAPRMSMDENVLKYTMKIGAKAKIPENENMGKKSDVKSNGNKLPP